MGEPSGIGGEITLKAWQKLHAEGPIFVVIDDPGRLKQIARDLQMDISISAVKSLAEGAAIFPHSLPVLPVGLRVNAQAGEPDTINAKAVIAAIEQAVALCISGEASAVVTNPIQKSNLTSAGFPFPGHTEFLEHLAGQGCKAQMMLAGRGLRVIPITIHEPLRLAIARLTTDLIIDAGRRASRSIREDLSIRNPRIAVAGLNPHAGENGTLGLEDDAIIAPAIRVLQADGIRAFGPVPPDTMFTTTARRTYDVALCMYHDQGLIPLKTLDMMGGVNITLGLPFVRTSPDHGTALDIAGKGVAEPSSLIAAIRMAANLAIRRRGQKIS